MTYDEANDLGGFFLDWCPGCTADPWKKEHPPLDAGGVAPDAYWSAGWCLRLAAPDGWYLLIDGAIEYDATGRPAPPSPADPPETIGDGAMSVPQNTRYVHRNKVDGELPSAPPVPAGAAARPDAVTLHPTCSSASEKRQKCIMVRVTSREWARLEEERTRAGVAEMAVYVRRVALARRGIAVVPELNRTAWVALLGRLERVEEMAHKLGQGQGGKPGGLGGLLGRGRQEVTPLLLLAEVRATREAIQAMRRALLGTP